MKNYEEAYLIARKAIMDAVDEIGCTSAVGRMHRLRIGRKLSEVLVSLERLELAKEEEDAELAGDN